MHIVIVTGASDLGRLVAQLAHNHGIEVRVAIRAEELAGGPCELVLVEVDGYAGDFGELRRAAPRAAVWALGPAPEGAVVDREFPSPPSLLDVMEALRAVTAGAETPPTLVPRTAPPRSAPSWAREALTLPPADRGAAPADTSVLKLATHLWAEVDRLERANAWTVLGVPAGSPAHVARDVADRFEAHYRDLAAHPEPRVRQGAERLLRLIARARALLDAR